MATGFRSSLPLLLAFILAGAAAVVSKAQSSEPSESQPVKTALADGIDRIAGEEPHSRIKYIRLILKGSLRVPAAPVSPDTDSSAPSPTLVAQCTPRPNGRSYFELFANFGSAKELTFYPPWTPASQDDLFPPRTEKVLITMDFLGYTHVKPVRRQWEIPVQTPGQYRYNPPGSGSTNLEEITYYLRYLLALPTLRLTLGNNSADFLTTTLLDQIRKEPLCRAAAL
jgi:hypothetical protein